jgi:hypothetical protein
MSLAQAFWKIFEGSPAASYDWNPNRDGQKYLAVEHGLTLEDVERHLAGRLPAVLSIPILENGCCHFAAADCDRHGPTDESLDHVAIAKEITSLGLPLVITRSKSPKSGHIWAFFKEKDGYDCASARLLIAHYMKRLGITGEIEIFPKQEHLKEGQLGSGINLPYFSAERFAFGKDGEPLDLGQFIELVRERQAFGKVLKDRDLADVPSGHRDPPGADEEHGMHVEIAWMFHEKNLEALRQSNTAGHWNDTLNTTAFFAARAFAAGAFPRSEKEIKDEIREAASAASDWDKRQMEATLASGWGSGVKKPLKILEKESKGAELRILAWLGLGDEGRKNSPYKSEEIYLDCALLSQEVYEDLRETVADILCIRVTKLDDFVIRRRPAKTGEEQSQVDFKPSASWTHAVDGAELLRDTAAAVRRFIVFKNPQDAEVVATWVLGTYLHNEFGIFPRLGVTSTFPESGKTTLMDFLEYSCLRSVRGDNISVSVFFRVIDEHHPCLLLDECDTFLVKNPELIGVLNSGHKKGGYVWRTEEINGKFVAVRFGTFSPVGYGMIGHPAATFFSRSIFIRLDRKTASQQVEDFDPEENVEQLELMENLRRRMVRWSDDHRAEVKDAKPDTGKLSNRARNNWRALLKIGQVAGGDWNSILMTAAGCPPPLTRKTIQEKLLKDVRNIFHSRAVDRLPSEVLVADLLAQKQSGWSRYHEGRTELDESDLADLLVDFGVEPETHHFPKEVQLSLWQKAKDKPLKLRGYLLEQFAGLIATYLTGAAEEVPVGSLHAPF